ncbi:phage portal protein [Actinobacillus equuli]|uniref:phage portal protein n=1 Tax=Actinobacillus equuli TaxID=718 RepID=UPI00244181EE|nr:phage portal protein [Actinobacillus equuli]WGE76096.1 phage portal protein [Actinobacillus equuli subsp. haemolyticus]WGE78033.1 phage portal protein [Actinobacillus equuli subsp. haemolyticus]
MTKRKKQMKNDRLQAVENSQEFANTQMFSFGDAVPMLDKRDILNYLHSTVMYGKYYAPPISWSGLAKSLRSSVHHESAITAKVNILANLIEIKYMSHLDKVRLLQDFFVFGNAYVQRVDNRLGNILRLDVPLARYMRKGVKDNTYWYINDYLDEYEFAAGSVYHLLEPDINQNIYGLPHYLSALQSAWLNESATLFRRKYYLNGAHAGFVFYMTDAAQKQEDIDNLREQLRKSKGVGNFKNLFVHAPSGKKDGIQIIPIADVAAKDEFFNIKNVSRDDVLAAHRVPPQLMSIVPSNTGGFGNVKDAAEVFYFVELQTLQSYFEQLNDWLGEKVVTFKEFKLLSSNT